MRMLKSGAAAPISQATIDAEAFNAFAAAGRDSKAASHGDSFGQITARLVEPLLDAAAIGPGAGMLDVATRPGYRRDDCKCAGPGQVDAGGRRSRRRAPLTEVLRQRDPDERRALAELHEGGSERYLAWAQQHDRVHAQPGPGALDAALADWQQAVAQHGPAQAVLIARDNQTRAALNDAAREHLRVHGALGVDHAYGPVTVAVGDRVICRRNDRFADVDNGTRGTVIETRETGLLLYTDAGTGASCPPATSPSMSNTATA
jgi:ATP-dependent exoDNAse (exonuclease V) alpha subunit